MRKRYPIEFSAKIDDVVYYPAEFPLNGTTLKIAFGSKSVAAIILPHPEAENVIVISKNIQAQLKMPELTSQLHLFVENETLFIGPLVGIFTAGFTPFPLRPVGDRSLFFAKLLSVQKSVGVLPFVFGEKHIDWENGLIKGYFYQQKGWEIIEVPFPNVIYDRLPNRRTEKLFELKKVKERLQNDYLIPCYNPGFFNKLEIHERLLQEDALSQYLPETHPFTSFSNIERMLADYGHVYIKPINGSLGFGVHQIIYDKRGGDYYCRYRDEHGKNKLKKFASLEILMRHIFSNQSLSKMLIQQGIDLIRHEKRQIDFRIHTNKDESGTWQVTAMAAKIAGPGSVTTHINNGGAIRTIEEVFPDENDQQAFLEKLTDAALELSKGIEKNIDGFIGEIGFDMGIDRNGRIWLFEANSKPGRSIFKHPRLKEFELLTRKFSLAFAVFLAEQAITKPEEVFK
ncbi:YheC/YheD family endospore coat-associated protein [Bacillus sp. V33-4]|uniref:YheC/YheD family endospore coat-associated protein n=1 Tax=Bacillus sp. V33-4 TaxID=2054169 RepID=UPI000C783098|nr:YheC/YheD family protein [Bacillus sp. V33-4]PLR86647.1 glutathione synthetase [Bacillus sp. V33-4]